jgi:hypothetical protein
LNVTDAFIMPIKRNAGELSASSVGLGGSERRKTGLLAVLGHNGAIGPILENEGMIKQRKRKARHS